MGPRANAGRSPAGAGRGRVGGMDLKHVYTARDSMEAHFVRGLLQQEGIDAVVQGEALQETWGNLNLNDESLPSVWVPEADVARSLPLIEDYRKRDQADATLEVGNLGDSD